METAQIKDWHAHVYFDSASRDPAWALRERIEKTFDIQMGRFHEKPVGPHPRYSYQVHFKNEQLASLLSWLTLNRGDERVQISGIVRAIDISPDNRILSTRVANAHIRYVGKGEIARASRQGWLQRFFSIISPF